MSFNTLQYDEDTKQRMRTYKNIMGNFSRFWVQLIAQENGIKFKWGVTSKDAIIRMMEEENVKIPTKAELDKYLANYKAKRDDAIKTEVETEVEVEKAEEVEDETETEDVDIDNMKRTDLVKLAFKLNIVNPMGQKNVDLIDLIKEAKKAEECQKT